MLILDGIHLCNLNFHLRRKLIKYVAGELRPITPTYLTTILELLLNCLVSLSLSYQAAPVAELTSALEDEHEIKPKVSTQVMSWFGGVNDERWSMNVDAVVKEIGLGILRAYKVRTAPRSLTDSSEYDIS